ncbi:MAG: hypothetical protein OEY40_01150 [Candidatus Bathyarchaeota archaeon]|nr:hypothetical protein [Candidatus Bathyarchaeota archaeon]
MNTLQGYPSRGIHLNEYFHNLPLSLYHLNFSKSLVKLVIPPTVPSVYAKNLETKK